MAKLDTSSALSRDLQGVNYLPGFVGLNNLGHTDHINAVVQALAHVRPVRDFFLQSVGAGLGLTQRLGELVRKVWSAHNFKSSVSPHEFSQVACHSSAGRFRIGDRGDCGRFLFFVLNSLRQDGKCPAARDCVEAAFQGLVEVSSSLETSDGHAAAEAGGTVARSKFLSLSLEVPPVPLFKDSEDHNAVPQVPILELLKKFDGTTVTHAVERGEHKRRRYRLLELPKCVSGALPLLPLLLLFLSSSCSSSSCCSPPTPAPRPPLPAAHELSSPLASGTSSSTSPAPTGTRRS